MKLQSKQPRSHVLPPRTEATTVVNSLSAAHQKGHAWGDMAVICRRYDEMDECAQALSRWKLRHQVRKGAGSFNRLEDTIKVLTMHASKGLEFAVVALSGVGQMPAPGDDEQEEARLFYVAATRATHRLVIAASGDGEFSSYFDVSPKATARAPTCSQRFNIGQ